MTEERRARATEWIRKWRIRLATFPNKSICGKPEIKHIFVSKEMEEILRERLAEMSEYLGCDIGSFDGSITFQRVPIKVSEEAILCQ